MIVPRSIVAPLALLVALTTATVSFNAGLASAPTAFFGDGSVIVIGPPGDSVPGQTTIDTSRVTAMRTLPDVQVVSPEVFALIELGGRSAFVRGVEFASFVAVEEAELVDGRMPNAPHEAIMGAGFARAFGLEAPADLLVPSSFERLGLPVTIVGTIETDGPAREELHVHIDDARTLMALEPNVGHIIRVRTTDPQTLTGLITSLGPAFTLADVKISTTEFVPGEPVLVTANLTNWGRVGGVKDVEVREGANVVGSRAYFVEAHTTIPIVVEFSVTNAGAATISVNPSFPVTVRDPSLRFVDLPRALALGRAYNVTVHDRASVPAPGVIVTDGTREVVTDEAGRAELIAERAGIVRLVAIRDGRTEAAAQVPVAEPGYEDVAHFVVTGASVRDGIIGTSLPFTLRISAENRGGADGAATFAVLLDGAPAGEASFVGAPGAVSAVEVLLGPVAPGTHEIRIEGTSIALPVRAFPGEDPRIEALLEGYQVSRDASGPRSTAAADAETYVTRVVGDVRAAVLALSVASGVLSALGAFAVMHRHLAERETRVGTLKGIGASDAYVLAVATREAALLGAAAAASGLVAGVVLAEALDASGLVWAFGHAVHPAHEWYAIAIIFLLSTLFVVVATRVILSLSLQRSVDTLMRGGALRPVAPEPRAIRRYLEGR